MGGDGETGAIGPGDSGGSGLSSTAAPTAARAPVAAAKSAGPAIIEAPVEVKPVYVAPKGPHKMRVPIWVMPVLISIPLWAFFFPGAFTNHHVTVITDPLVLGKQVYQGSCSTCHGANGEGGVGPALHGGVSVGTFPEIAEQIKWIDDGSMGLAKNAPFGSPTNPRGQQYASKNDMPAFANALTPAQIMDVALFERSKL